MTPGEDHVARVDAEQVEDIVEDIELFAAIRTKVKPRLWLKKHESCNAPIPRIRGRHCDVYT